MATARKLPSGNFRVRVYEDGKYISFTAPTKKEAERLAATHTKKKGLPMSVRDAIEGYIASKSAVLSPSTIRGYDIILRNNIPEELLRSLLFNLTEEKLQRMLNDLAKDHSPKTCANVKGLLTASLKMYLPEKTFRLTVPAKIKNETKIPTDDEVRIMLENSWSLDIGLAIRLAAFGSLRRSEICALMSDCVYDDHIDVKRACVQDKDKKWVIKDCPKTYAGYRSVYLAPEIMETVKEYAERAPKGKPIYPHTPVTLSGMFMRFCKLCELPPYRFHSLRHYFASSMQGRVPDSWIQKVGGWEDAATLRRIYTHAKTDEEDDVKEALKIIYSNVSK